ncbi:hypothetical protein RI054_20g90850 [Pseudoscourfieldia marina]
MVNSSSVFSHLKGASLFSSSSKSTSSSTRVRIFFSLLLICYLEVCLWSFCLSAGNCVEGSAYLSRETQNLSATNVVGYSNYDLNGNSGAVHFHGYHGKSLENLFYSDWALKLERRVVQYLSHQELGAAGRLVDRLVDGPARLPFTLNQGVPAPYTGINAVQIRGVPALTLSLL